jgi:putative ABC transport system permease protein
MSVFLGIRHTLRSIVARRAADADTLEELADHIHRQTRKHVAEGMTPADAERLALIELGGMQRWRDETAESRVGSVGASLIGDCKFAVRTLRKRPGFAVVAVLSLALGLGASGAIFGVIDGALLRPLPFPDADRLASISLRMPIPASRSVVDMTWSYPKYLIFRDRQRVFSAVALNTPTQLTLSEADGVQRINGEAVTSPYFALLGATPAMGRTFAAAEDSVGGGGSVIVVSDGFWRAHLGADPNTVGRMIDASGAKRTIVGVMRPGFQGLTGDAELWLPVTGVRSAAALASAGAHNMSMFGRLQNDVTPRAAQAAVEALGKRIDEAFPSDDGHWSAGIRTFDEVRVAPTVRRALELLAVAVALVIAMVFVNLLTLFLTRGLARRGELAVRVAIGADRFRIVRQIVTEAVVVALIGASASMLIGVAAFRFLIAKLPTSIPAAGPQTELTRLSFAQTTFGARAIAFSLLIALTMGILMGVATALRSIPLRLIDGLRQTGSAASATRGRGVLVATQIALAVVLLIVAGLTVDSLRRVLAVPLGYQPDGVFAVQTTLDRQEVASSSPLQAWTSVQHEVAAIPGVVSSAYASCAPIGFHCDGTSVTPAGHAIAMHTMYMEVSAGYFATVRTPLIRGREFSDADIANNEQVMMINREAARRIWGSDDPMTTPADFGDRKRRIIGIVEDARYEDPERAPEPAIYMPAIRMSGGVFLVRSSHAGAPIAADIRAALRRANHGNSVGAIRELGDRLRDATARNRLSASIVTVFAITALLLAGLGVYGSLALSVIQRSREFAIRRALGANPRSLVSMILSRAAKLAGVGAVVGIALGLAASRGMSGLLYDARPLAPGLYVSSMLLLALAVAAAALVPSLRSMRADPRDAMRAD